MKTHIPLVLILITLMGFTQNEDNRVDVFLKKIEKFYEKSSEGCISWSMPNHDSDNQEYNMPMSNPYFLDHETGLAYSPPKGKIYDNELQLVLDMNSASIYDMKTGKTYSLEDLILRKKT